MADGVYRPNSAGFKALAVSPKVREAVEAEAARGKVIAEGLSQDFRKTGNYADSFEVSNETVELNTKFGSHPVAAGVLTNKAGYAAAVEYGFKGRSAEESSSAHHILGRTLEALAAE